MSEENTQDKQRKSQKLGKINVGEIHSKDSVTHNNAEPVFLLFKQALATGWDCPRAKVLVKLRENMSETFEIQTLGRLRRMPNAKHYGRDILDCSYLYTFDEDYKNEVTGNHLGAEYKRVVLKEAARTIELKKNSVIKIRTLVMKARSENSFFLSLKKNTNLQIITKKISYAFKIKV